MGEFLIFSIIMIIIGIIMGCEKNRYVDKIYLIFFCLVFCSMAALRGRYIGNDTDTYLRLFSSISELPLSIDISFGRFEKGFVLLNKFLSFISTNPQIILIFSSMVTYIALYIFIRRESKHYWISIILFLINGYYRLSMSAIRQMIAISILIFGYYALKEKKYIKYMIIATVAFSIHSSAIVPAIIIYIATLNWKKFYYKILLTISIVVMLSKDIIIKLVSMFFNFSRYIGSKYDDGINIASIMLVLMCLACLLVIYYSNKKDYNSNIFFKIEFIRLCMLLIALRLNSIDRMADYFFVFEIVGVTNALSKYKYQNTRQILLISLFFCYILYSVIWGVMRPDTQMIWPYKTFWM